MPVVNPAKRAAAQGKQYKTITRKVFRGDPGLCKFVHNPEPLNTSRKLKPQYEQNVQNRKQQRAPAERGWPTRKGPTKRAPGTGREQWCRLLSGK